MDAVSLQIATSLMKFIYRFVTQHLSSDYNDYQRNKFRQSRLVVNGVHLPARYLGDTTNSLRASAHPKAIRLWFPN